MLEVLETGGKGEHCQAYRYGYSSSTDIISGGSPAQGFRSNGAFATELGNYIADSRIDAWIYGHSHTNIDTTIGNTKIICNQMGYIYYNEHLTNGFEPNKTIVIE